MMQICGSRMLKKNYTKEIKTGMHLIFDKSKH